MLWAGAARLQRWSALRLHAGAVHFVNHTLMLLPDPNLRFLPAPL